MREVVLPKSLAAASVDCISKGQTLAAAGNILLNGTDVVGGVAVLDTQRRILITSDGDDSGVTFKLTGGNQTGQPINEIVQGGSKAAVSSVLDFLTLGTVYADGKIASHVTIGTSGTGSTPWIMPNYNITPFDAQLNVVVAGTVTYSVETTMDSYALPANPTTQPIADATTLAASTISGALSMTSPVVGIRTTVTADTGTVTTKFLQAGITNA